MASPPTHGESGRTLRLTDLAGVFFFGGASLILLILCWSLTQWPAALGPEQLAGIAVVLVLLHVALVGRRVCAVDSVVWIPVAMLMFYFGMPFARMLGSAAPYNAWEITPPINLERGFAVALLTLTSLLAGMHLHGISDRQRPDHTPWHEANLILFASLGVFSLGILCILVGLVQTGPSVILGTYVEVVENKAVGADFRFFDIGLVLAKGGVVGVIAAHRPGRMGTTLCAIGVTILLALLSARLGDRGGLMAFAFAAAWVVSQRVQRIPAALVAIGAIAAFFLLPAIKEYRTTRSIQATLELNPIEATAKTLYETGTSVLTFAYTLDLIPSEKPYGWGISYARSVAHLLPNIGFTPGKSFLPNVLVASPSHWLVQRIHPIKYEQGGGYGYAIGAEWYFNFGMLGVPIGMMFTGYMLCFFRERSRRSPLWLIWSAFYFSMAALTVRNILGAPLKIATWPLIGIWGLRNVARFFTGSKRPHALEATASNRLGDAT